MSPTAIRGAGVMVKDYVAHVRLNPDGTWATPHSLRDHLVETACLARSMASKFQSGDWAGLAAIAHDVGKGRDVWQNYIRRKSGYEALEAHLEGKAGKIPHAIFGVGLVEQEHGRVISKILSYCIAGHHRGLPDWSSGYGVGSSALCHQLSHVEAIGSLPSFMRPLIKDMPSPRPPFAFGSGLDMSLWIRMLFSCLVDSDFLDTERYMDHKKGVLRGGYEPIGSLLLRLEAFNEKLDLQSEDTPVNKTRRLIRQRCMEIAIEKPGVFSLSVPTGGGKTLSSLTFALNHAKIHDLDRVIYVIPYTSIIEQNAEVFKKALGEDQVVEHHSNLGEGEHTPRQRIACENWDAPVIVTTSVQFFESLFAHRSSRCRKLHNIVKSVVVLDEAQLLPVEYLKPIVETIRLLCKDYGTTFLISTATQPALEEPIEGVMKGLTGIREIMGDDHEVRELYDSLARVNIEFPASFETPTEWDVLARELEQHHQVLCIVSDRKSCRELHGLMPEGTYHLSALMCGQHRSEVIEEVKKKLRNHQQVRVISTQLVEAGVDLDFPFVYRSLAGLDSIAQAAGRCNREGKLPDLGTLKVFVPPKAPPAGILRKARDITASLVKGDVIQDPLDPSSFAKFFSQLYHKALSLDSQEIMELLSRDARSCEINFQTASERFNIIDSSKMRSILVPYGEGSDLIAELRSGGESRRLLRKLQRYSVNVYVQDFEAMRRRGSIEEVQPWVFALSSEVEYSPKVGLYVGDVLIDLEDLCV